LKADGIGVYTNDNHNTDVMRAIERGNAERLFLRFKV
jgi:hypothetical protein